MKTPCIFGTRPILIGTMVAASVLPLVGQTAEGAFTPPRLADGHPDLQGLWRLAGGFGSPPIAEPGPLNGEGTAPDPAGGRGGGNRYSRIEYLPAALAKKQELITTARFQDQTAHCQSPSVPRATLEPPYPLLILQDGSQLVILYEFVHGVRIIRADGSPHPKTFSAMDGDSRGRWEGNTFVVDVTNFRKGIRWLSMGGDFLDENEHAVERYTLTGPDTILYEVTVEDPTVLAKPWTTRGNLLRQPKDDQILEDACLEGERDLQHYTEKDGAKKSK